MNSLSKLCDILSLYKINEHRICLIKPEGRIHGSLVAFREVEERICGLSLPYKISIKRRDQPFIFVNVFGREETKNVRRY
jgi:hypothetical protein